EISLRSTQPARDEGRSSLEHSASFDPSAVRVNNEAGYSGRREADLVMTSTGHVGAPTYMGGSSVNGQLRRPAKQKNMKPAALWRESCFGSSFTNGGRCVRVAQLVSIPSAEPFSTNALNTPATHGPSVWCP